MLIGQGAEEFSKKMGLEQVDPSYYYTEERYKEFLDAKKEDEKKEKKFGTVGAVALDKFGHIAAATSTGGMTNKKFGRVGGVPIIGAGTYANSLCGISCTGHGEFFIRAAVAHDIAAIMEYKKVSLDEAAKEVIHKKMIELGGEGGIIGVDNTGNISLIFNTEGMYRGFVKGDGKYYTSIFKDK